MMPPPRLAVARLLLVLIAATGAAAGASGEDWPRWRGAHFDSTAADPEGRLDRPFSLVVRWRRTIGSGYSGVVVAAGHAVTMASDGEKDFLLALDAENGAERWRLPLGAAFPARDGSSGGPVSTPAIDAGTVYALGPRGQLAAVDLATGAPRWQRDLVAELAAVTPHWGFTTSPLVTAHHVVVLTGGDDGAVTAFHRASGEVAWRAGADVASYQSPILVELGGRELVVVGGDRFLWALDPGDGREVWRIEHGGEGFYGRILNPVVVAPGELLLTSRFAEAVLLRVDGTPAPAWTTPELKLNYATPVVHDGLVFGYSGRFLGAVDARSGELVWRSRLPGDGFPIVVGEHLAVLTKTGRLAIGPADAEGWREKASLQVFDRLVWTPPSFAGGRFYARDSYAEIAAIDVVPAAVADAVATAAPATSEPPPSSFARWVAATSGAPDAAARVATFLASQERFPILEGERLAHVVYTGPEDEVLLRGDVVDVGSELPLQRVAGTDLHWVTLELPPDARIVYQLVTGTGDAGETIVADPRNPMRTQSLNYAGPVSVLAMPDAAPAAVAWAAEAPGATTRGGRVVDLAFTSPQQELDHLRWGGERRVRVQLPAGYDAEPGRRYPTVYVLYGDQMLDEARLDVAVDRERGVTIEPAIVVFVQSNNPYEYARTLRHFHDRMLTRELVPWIDARFRTRAEPASRVLLGADEAGYGAVETGLLHPEVFGAIVAQSIFAMTGDDRKLLDLVADTPPSAQRFWVDWGRHDPRRRTDGLDVAAYTREVSARLAAAGHAVGGGEYPDGSGLLLWRQRAIAALGELLPAPAPITE